MFVGTTSDAGFDRLMLGDRVFRVDARTRIVNCPADAVHAGQALRVTASRCGNRLIADRIAFVGPTVEPVRYQRAAASHDTAFAWGAVALILLERRPLILFERLTRP